MSSWNYWMTSFWYVKRNCQYWNWITKSVHYNLRWFVLLVTIYYPAPTWKSFFESISIETSFGHFPYMSGFLDCSTYSNATYCTLKIVSQLISKDKKSGPGYVENHACSWKLDKIFVDTKWLLKILWTEVPGDAYFERRLQSGKLDVFRYIDEYRGVIYLTPTNSDQILWVTKASTTDLQKLFNAKIMRWKKVVHVVGNDCIGKNMKSECLKNWSPTHGLRWMFYNLILSTCILPCP